MIKSGLSSLNIRASRGKWYVSLRGTTLSLVKGFAGTREELERYLTSRQEEFEDAIRQHDNRFANSQRSWRYDAAMPILISAQKRAKARGMEFTLTFDWLLERLERIGDRCEMTGLPFDYQLTKTAWHKRPDSPSLDRIERSLGYVDGNVRIVSTAVNIAINEWGDARFYQMCEAVVRKRKNAVQKRPVSIVFSRSQSKTLHNKNGHNVNEINKLAKSSKGF